MKNKIIITEGKVDKDILENIFKGALSDDTEIVASGGYSAAISKATSILSILKKDVLLVLDADTINEHVVREKEQFINDSINTDNLVSNFKLILFKPSLIDYLINYYDDFKNSDKMLKRNMNVMRLLKSEPSTFLKFKQLPEINKIMEFIM